MRIFISAGEPSGDQHAAHLIQTLKARDASIEVEGFGGPAMREAGCSVLFELTNLAVMGIIKVIPLLAKFRRLLISAEQHFDTSRPDVVLLVDFPGFNWWIAKAARRRGIPVYYYLPPQLWAWAPWRIRKVRKWVDKVLCALPFEFDWYRTRGIDAVWVGHPFFDEVAAHKLDSDFLQTIKQECGQRPVIGILPGSRDHEVERNFPVIADIIQKVTTELPNVRWLVGNYRSEHAQRCQNLMMPHTECADISFHVNKTSEVIEAADCCLMVSGSISLELLARQTPGIVLYRISRLARWASRLVMTCRYITLTNLIATAEIMPEYVSAGHPENDSRRISDRLIELCTDQHELDACRQRMAQLATKAAVTGASQKVAEILCTDFAAKCKSAYPEPNAA